MRNEHTTLANASRHHDDHAFSLFDTNRIATKIPLYAIERKAAFESLGFAQSGEHLIGTIDGYAYKDYWILEKGAENE